MAGDIRILSFDGGPGPVLQVMLLQEVVNRYPTFFDEPVIFTGTSDGGLVSLFLADRLNGGMAPAEALNQCLEFIERYSAAFVRDKRLIAFALGAWAYASVVPFREELESTFGEKTLDSIRTGGKHQVAVTIFDTASWRARLPRSFGFGARNADAPEYQPSADYADLSLVEVALATSSLPVFTQIHRTPDNEGNLDGFVSANNPAMSVLTTVVQDVVRQESPTGDPFNEVVLLSLGVSQTLEEADLGRRGGLVRSLIMLLSDRPDLRRVARHRAIDLPLLLFNPDLEPAPPSSDIDDDQLDWGWWEVLSRAPYFLNLMLSGQSGTTTHQCASLLTDTRFHRYEPRIHNVRAVMRFLIRRNQGALEELRKVRDVCLFGTVGTPSLDDAENIARTERFFDWIGDRWVVANNFLENVDTSQQSRVSNNDAHFYPFFPIEGPRPVLGQAVTGPVVAVGPVFPYPPDFPR